MMKRICFLIVFVLFLMVQPLRAYYLCEKDQTIYPDFDTCAAYCDAVWCIEKETYVCLPSSVGGDEVPPPESLEGCSRKRVCPFDYHMACNDPGSYFPNNVPDCTITRAPVCSCGYTYDPANDWCEREEINVCDPGYSYSEYYSQKYGVHVCVAPYWCSYGSYDPSDERCETTLSWHWECPVAAEYGCADYFGNGNVICGNVGTCSAVTDNGTVIGYECSLGGFYSDASTCASNCYEAWSCSKVDDCPPGYSPDWGENVCYGSVNCPGSGSFYPPEELCYVFAEIRCPSCSGEAADYYANVDWSGHSVGIGSPVFDSATDKCLYGPFCPWPPPQFPVVCPDEHLTYGNRQSYYAGGYDYCLYAAECVETWTCPSNIDAGCADAAAQECYEPDPIDESYYHDDGQFDNSTGQCMGTILLLNGRPLSCRPPGYETGFHNCCDADDEIVEDVGNQLKLMSGTLALIRNYDKIADAVEVATTAIKAYNDFQAGYVGAVPTEYWDVVTHATSATDAAQKAIQAQLGISPGSIITSVALSVAIDFAGSIIFGGCSGKDVTTAAYKENGLCHYVGKKCVKRIPIIGCIQKAKVYCCFSSVLARIIHEQGRPQLKNFGPDGGWGTAKQPNCRGFYPDEFQMIDLSKIDFSEFETRYADQILERMPDNLQLHQSLQEKINQFFGNGNVSGNSINSGSNTSGSSTNSDNYTSGGSYSSGTGSTYQQGQSTGSSGQTLYLEPKKFVYVNIGPKSTYHAYFYGCSGSGGFNNRVTLMVEESSYYHHGVIEPFIRFVGANPPTAEDFPSWDDYFTIAQYLYENTELKRGSWHLKSTELNPCPKDYLYDWTTWYGKINPAYQDLYYCMGMSLTRILEIYTPEDAPKCGYWTVTLFNNTEESRQDVRIRVEVAE